MIDGLTFKPTQCICPVVGIKLASTRVLPTRFPFNSLLHNECDACVSVIMVNMQCDKEKWECNLTWVCRVNLSMSSSRRDCRREKEPCRLLGGPNVDKL